MTMKKVNFLSHENQYIRSLCTEVRGSLMASRTNPPTSVNSSLIYKLSGAIQSRFLYIAILLKRTLFQYRK